MNEPIEPQRDQGCPKDRVRVAQVVVEVLVSNEQTPDSEGDISDSNQKGE